jgi:hypothetical protein
LRVLLSLLETAFLSSARSQNFARGIIITYDGMKQWVKILKK